MNLCRSCQLDFGSAGAFDAHRVGRHAYDFSFGRPDGRRCLQTPELLKRGWHQDKTGRWRQPIDEKALLRIRESRSRVARPSAKPKQVRT